ncbi:TetR family transcriptional regulator [Sphingomonas sp. ID0503]|uniref:TetR family transcriptional regulator n=1 Tax=Sphingomonas sp. ID0503 TaxID=3399691 RepID=UPI003AFACFF6
MVSRAKRELGTPNARVLAREASREALITAAADIMRERDSLDFPLTEVGLRTGNSAALVQYHFGSKEGLLMAVVERHTAAAARDMAALAASDYSAEKKLRLHIRGVVSAYVRSPFTNRLLNHLQQNADEERSRHISEIFIKPVADFHRAILEQGVREGLFRPIDPMHFYHMVVGACEHLVAYKTPLNHTFGVKEINDDLRRDFADTIFDVLVAGIAARPSL